MLVKDSVLFSPDTEGSAECGIAGTASIPFRNTRKGLRHLAEAIILQSIEDLWDPEHRIASLNFFRGEGFRECAGIAGMSGEEQTKILNIIRQAGEGIC